MSPVWCGVFLALYNSFCCFLSLRTEGSVFGVLGLVRPFASGSGV